MLVKGENEKQDKKVNRFAKLQAEFLISYFWTDPICCIMTKPSERGSGESVYDVQGDPGGCDAAVSH